MRIPYPFAYPRWQDLPWSSRRLLGLPFVASLIVTAPLFYVAVIGLGDALDIPRAAPVRDHPRAIPFMSVLLVLIVGWVVLCWFVAVVIVAGVLCARGTLSRTEASTLVRTGRCPDGWYAN